MQGCTENGERDGEDGPEIPEDLVHDLGVLAEASQPRERRTFPLVSATHRITSKCEATESRVQQPPGGHLDDHIERIPNVVV